MSEIVKGIVWNQENEKEKLYVRKVSVELPVMEKLKILADAAKFDVACTSSGVTKKNPGSGIGNSMAAGICHTFSSDGRCISLLKILYTNECIYNCKYCINRASNDVVRACFTPEEICELVIGFYRRNYIEGLFLSSGILKSPDYTMELLCRTLKMLREEYHFHGYIHLKAIPGADERLIELAGFYADRMSVNLELPTAEGLKALAPNKSRKAILTPMRQIQLRREEDKYELAHYRHAESEKRFCAAGQSSQMIVGATGETDLQIMSVTETLYQKFDLKRVFYSAFVNVNHEKQLPATLDGPPLLREHRLYQADWLLRFYEFEVGELLDEKRPNFNIYFDPKCDWALRHLACFPVEINSADYHTLLRVPGIGHKSAGRIVKARRFGSLDFEDLKRIGVVLKRAVYFITCKGKQMYPLKVEEDFITRQLLGVKEALPPHLTENVTYKQLSLFDDDFFMQEQSGRYHDRCV